jgi:hypothetical protein
LNEAIREKLVEFNTKPFQKMDGSRWTRYLEEKDFLLPLPRYSFERSEWTIAKVQKDYHVKCGDRYYSVPHTYIGYTVDVKATRDMVEVFYEGVRISSQQRKYFGDKYVTDKNHMPDDHRKHGEWSGERFKSWARKIGPSTLNCVEHFLNSVKVEQQAYKTCNALLHLSDRYSPARLEAACSKVISFTPRPSYKAVDSVLKSGRDQDQSLTHTVYTGDSAAEKHGFIRGAEYYGKNSGGNCYDK